jgi:hypothetical protein
MSDVCGDLDKLIQKMRAAGDFAGASVALSALAHIFELRAAVDRAVPDDVREAFARWDAGRVGQPETAFAYLEAQGAAFRFVQRLLAVRAQVGTGEDQAKAPA